MNTRLAYVAVSRASQDAQIYTDDADSLGKRISAVAKEHESTRERTIVLSEKKLDRAAITAQIRAELQQAGRLARDHGEGPVLREQQFKEAGRAADYKPGDVIHYGKGSPKHCLLPKTEATVKLWTRAGT